MTPTDKSEHRPGRHMLADIAEQPQRLAAAFAGARPRLRECAELLSRAREVVLLGRGSSRAACTFAAHAVREITGLPATVASPAQLAWAPLDRPCAGALVVAVSQSGESTEIVDACSQVVKAGGDVIVVTNTPGSALAALVPAERTLLFQAGTELAVPATKSFTTSLGCLVALTCSVDLKRFEAAANELPAHMQAVVDTYADDRRLGDRIGPVEAVVTAGEGYAQAVAEEAAIKLRETLSMPVASFESSEFLHGSVNSVNGRTAVVVVSADPLGHHLATQVVTEANARGSRTVSVGVETVQGADVRLTLPRIPPMWVPFLAVIPLQVAVHDEALARGLDPDFPDGLTKVTRIEALTASQAERP